MIGFIRQAAEAAAVAVLSIAGTASAQESVDLFTDEPSVTARGRALFEPIPGISRDLMGEVAYFTLSSAGDRNIRSGSRGGRRLRIALPEGETATCSFPPEPDSASDSGTKLLSGSVTNAPDVGRCDLVVGDEGVLGDVQTPSGRYRIVPVGNGDHAVVKIRTERFAPEREPRQRPGGAEPQEQQRDGRLLDKFCDQRMNASLPPRTLGPIRVMILYTPAARAKSYDINADIALLMSGLRRSFSAESTGGNFSVAVELAHAQMIDHRESTQGMGGDLDQLSDPSDAVFGVVPQLRRRYKADLVHLLIDANEDDGCGLGWFNPNPRPDNARWSTSVSDIECATGNYSFIHELGHNIGMAHDRAVVPDASPEDSNFGYVVLDREVRSVMAYNNACAANDIYCQRLPYFSTPRLQVGGSPLGRTVRESNGAYNVEALCRGAAVVAGFRDPYGFVSYENQDVTGEEIARVKGLGQDACAARCEGNATCEAYTFDKWNDWCFLKGSITGLRLEPKAVSGLRAYYSEPPRSGRSLEMVRYRGKHFPGKGYETHRASSMEGCEKVCRGDGHCVGFTYYLAESRCEAFATLDEYFSDDRADSGVKTQPFAAGDN
jgi:hypothetical protein